MCVILTMIISNYFNVCTAMVILKADPVMKRGKGRFFHQAPYKLKDPLRCYCSGHHRHSSH